MINREKKTDFVRVLADSIEQWYQSPSFTLAPPTASALTTTLPVHAMLIDDLLNEAYQYGITPKLQSDPVERRFSRYRQMSGGIFLVSLRKVFNSDRILRCRSLIEGDILFCKEDLTSKNQECVTVIGEIFDTTTVVVSRAS